MVQKFLGHRIMVVKMLKIRIIESYKARYKRYSWLKNPLDRNIIKKCQIFVFPRAYEKTI